MRLFLLLSFLFAANGDVSLVNVSSQKGYTFGSLCSGLSAARTPLTRTSFSAASATSLYWSAFGANLGKAIASYSASTSSQIIYFTSSQLIGFTSNSGRIGGGCVNRIASLVCNVNEVCANYCSWCYGGTDQACKTNGGYSDGTSEPYWGCTAPGGWTFPIGGADGSGQTVNTNCVTYNYWAPAQCAGDMLGYFTHGSLIGNLMPAASTPGTTQLLAVPGNIPTRTCAVGYFYSGLPTASASLTIFETTLFTSGSSNGVWQTTFSGNSCPSGETCYIPKQFAFLVGCVNAATYPTATTVGVPVLVNNIYVTRASATFQAATPPPNPPPSPRPPPPNPPPKPSPPSFTPSASTCPSMPNGQYGTTSCTPSGTCTLPTSSSTLFWYQPAYTSAGCATAAAVCPSFPYPTYLTLASGATSTITLASLIGGSMPAAGQYISCSAGATGISLETVSAVNTPTGYHWTGPTSQTFVTALMTATVNGQPPNVTSSGLVGSLLAYSYGLASCGAATSGNVYSPWSTYAATLAQPTVIYALKPPLPSTNSYFFAERGFTATKGDYDNAPGTNNDQLNLPDLNVRGSAFIENYYYENNGIQTMNFMTAAAAQAGCAAVGGTLATTAQLTAAVKSAKAFHSASAGWVSDQSLPVYAVGYPNDYNLPWRTATVNSGLTLDSYENNLINSNLMYYLSNPPLPDGFNVSHVRSVNDGRVTYGVNVPMYAGKDFRELLGLTPGPANNFQSTETFNGQYKNSPVYTAPIYTTVAGMTGLGNIAVINLLAKPWTSTTKFSYDKNGVLGAGFGIFQTDTCGGMPPWECSAPNFLYCPGQVTGTGQFSTGLWSPLGPSQNGLEFDVGALAFCYGPSPISVPTGYQVLPYSQVYNYNPCAGPVPSGGKVTAVQVPQAPINWATATCPTQCASGYYKSGTSCLAYAASPSSLSYMTQLPSSTQNAVWATSATKCSVGQYILAAPIQGTLSPLVQGANITCSACSLAAFTATQLATYNSGAYYMNTTCDGTTKTNVNSSWFAPCVIASSCASNAHLTNTTCQVVTGVSKLSSPWNGPWSVGTTPACLINSSPPPSPPPPTPFPPTPPPHPPPPGTVIPAPPWMVISAFSNSLVNTYSPGYVVVLEFVGVPQSVFDQNPTLIEQAYFVLNAEVSPVGSVFMAIVSTGPDSTQANTLITYEMRTSNDNMVAITTYITTNLPSTASSKPTLLTNMKTNTTHLNYTSAVCTLCPTKLAGLTAINIASSTAAYGMTSSFTLNTTNLTSGYVHVPATFCPPEQPLNGGLYAAAAIVQSVLGSAATDVVAMNSYPAQGVCTTYEMMIGTNSVSQVKSLVSGSDNIFTTKAESFLGYNLVSAQFGDPVSALANLTLTQSISYHTLNVTGTGDFWSLRYLMLVVVNEVCAFNPLLIITNDMSTHELAFVQYGLALTAQPVAETARGMACISSSAAAISSKVNTYFGSRVSVQIAPELNGYSLDLINPDVLTGQLAYAGVTLTSGISPDLPWQYYEYAATLAWAQLAGVSLTFAIPNGYKAIGTTGAYIGLAGPVSKTYVPVSNATLQNQLRLYGLPGYNNVSLVAGLVSNVGTTFSATSAPTASNMWVGTTVFTGMNTPTVSSSTLTAGSNAPAQIVMALLNISNSQVVINQYADFGVSLTVGWTCYSCSPLTSSIPQTSPYFPTLTAVSHTGIKQVTQAVFTALSTGFSFTASVSSPNPLPDNYSPTIAVQAAVIEMLNLTSNSSVFLQGYTAPGGVFYAGIAVDSKLQLTLPGDITASARAYGLPFCNVTLQVSENSTKDTTPFSSQTLQSSSYPAGLGTLKFDGALIETEAMRFALNGAVAKILGASPNACSVLDVFLDIANTATSVGVLVTNQPNISIIGQDFGLGHRRSLSAISTDAISILTAAGFPQISSVTYNPLGLSQSFVALEPVSWSAFSVIMTIDMTHPLASTFSDSRYRPIETAFCTSTDYAAGCSRIFSSAVTSNTSIALGIYFGGFTSDAYQVLMQTKLSALFPFSTSFGIGKYIISTGLPSTSGITMRPQNAGIVQAFNILQLSGYSYGLFFTAILSGPSLTSAYAVDAARIGMAMALSDAGLNVAITAVSVITSGNINATRAVYGFGIYFASSAEATGVKAVLPALKATILQQYGLPQLTSIVSTPGNVSVIPASSATAAVNGNVRQGVCFDGCGAGQDAQYAAGAITAALLGLDPSLITSDFYALSGSGLNVSSCFYMTIPASYLTQLQAAMPSTISTNSKFYNLAYNSGLPDTITVQEGIAAAYSPPPPNKSPPPPLPPSPSPPPPPLRPPLPVTKYSPPPSSPPEPPPAYPYPPPLARPPPINVPVHPPPYPYHAPPDPPPPPRPSPKMKPPLPPGIVSYPPEPPEPPSPPPVPHPPIFAPPYPPDPVFESPPPAPPEPAYAILPIAKIGAQRVLCTDIYLVSIMNMMDLKFIVNTYATAVGLSYTDIGYKVRNTIYVEFQALPSSPSYNPANYTSAIESHVAGVCKTTPGNVAVNYFVSDTTIDFIVFVTGEGISATCVDNYDISVITNGAFKQATSAAGVQIMELDFNVPTTSSDNCTTLKSVLNRTITSLIAPKDLYMVGTTSASKNNRNPLKGYTTVASSGAMISDAQAVTPGVILPVVSTLLVVLFIGGVVVTTYMSFARFKRRTNKDVDSLI